jgi:hypothetical protein
LAPLWAVPAKQDWTPENNHNYEKCIKRNNRDVDA